MLASALRDAIRVRFPDPQITEADHTSQWDIPPRELIPACEFLRDHELAQFDLLLALFVVAGRALYVLRSVQRRHCLTLRVTLGDPAVLDSAAFVWPAANWLERQATELWEVRFRRHPDPRPLFGGRDETPWRDLTCLAHGASPTSLDGLFVRIGNEDQALTAEPVLGYRRCGLEAALCRWPYHRGTVLAARLDAFSAMNVDLAYAQAVESLLGIDLPSRAQDLRLILAELQRINSHLCWLGRSVARLADPAFAVPAYAAQARHTIRDLFQWLGGNPVTPDVIAVGGVRTDLPEGLPSRIEAACCRLQRDLEDLRTLLNGGQVFAAQLWGVGVLDAGTALGLGLTGPALRASGIDYDVRRALPYAAYARQPLRVPVHRKGDAWARFRVRLAELGASLELVQSTLSGLHDGPVNALAVAGDRGRPALPPVPAGVACASVEGPRGELSVLLSSDGSARPQTVYLRGPSLANLSALPYMVRNASRHQISLILDSLDVSISEAER